MANFFKQIGNKLFGEDKVTAQADPEAYDIKQTALKASHAQRQGLLALMNQKPDQLADAQISRETSAMRDNLADQRRQIQQNIARRGLQNTSIGQTALNAAERNNSQGISRLLASNPLLQRQMAEQLINAGARVSSAQNVPLRFEDERTQKQGIFPLLLGTAGALVGAKYGGAQGAAAGGQMGYGAGQGISGLVR